MTIRFDGPADADPALDVRAELSRSAADLPVGELLSGVHDRAGRIRQRRRFAAGVVVGAAAAVVATAVIVPVVTAGREGSDRPAGVEPSVVAPVSVSATATPTGAPGTPAGTTGPAGPGATATPWGATTFDEEFPGTTLDRNRWTVYDGPGDRLGRWSPGDVAVADGKLLLTVSRPGGDPPSTWGGIGAMGAGQRYGRWEVRMRMSTGRGVLGQFLLNPTGAEPSIVVSVSPYGGTIGLSGTGTGAAGTRVKPLPRPAEAHVVAVEWTPQAVRVLVDGTTMFEWTDAVLPAPLWPAFQAIMAGPDCGTVPPVADCMGATTTFPQRFEVERLRVRAL